jgi:hypothetical protein
MTKWPNDAAIFFVPRESFCRGKTSWDRNANQVMENSMNQRLIRYKTKPDMGDKNAELISAVFAELKAAHPDGIRYLTLRLEDDTFIHLVETTTEDGANGLTKLAAFQAFQSGVRDRCVEPPLVRGATIVGNYRMLGEP